MAQVLRRLNSISASPPDALLVGNATGDDAAVWRLDARTALVHTLDFFTPIVDDAYDWGRIAAANALSDVYAMGGRPVLCLNIAAWPREGLSLDLLGRVLEGGAAVATHAGAIVAGGHTIDDAEPKYGMAVVGLADPERIATNDAARAGDLLYLTKPLGLGVISTGIKRGIAKPDVIDDAVRVMTTLNRDASEAMLAAGVRAATDVTGFGLLGHLQKMMQASGVSAEIDAGAVPVIDGAAELVAAGAVPGGTERNRAHLEPWVTWNGVTEPARTLLVDAQTSGGLLLACPSAASEGLEGELRSRDVLVARIGRVRDGRAGAIEVRE